MLGSFQTSQSQLSTSGFPYFSTQWRAHWIDQFAPLGVVLGRIGPAGVDVVVVIAGFPVMLIRLGMRGERLRHEPDLHQRLHVALDVGVEDAVGDGPVVDWPARGVFGVGIGRAPLEGGFAIARDQQAVDAHVDGHGAERGELGEELAAIFHVSVVGLVVAEETPDGLQGTAGLREVDADDGGRLRQEGRD